MTSKRLFKPRIPVWRQLRDTRGSVMVMAALTTVPILGLWGFQSELARYQMRQMRLHQTQAMAVQAIAKEGPGVPDASLIALTHGFLARNLPPVGLPAEGAEVVLERSEDRESLRVSLPVEPLFAPIAGLEWPAHTLEVAAARTFRETEATFVMDSSASLNMYGDAVAQLRHGISDYLNEAFRNQEESRDYRVSLVSYAGMVNLGWSAKDKLVTPKSRRIPPQLETVARENGWWDDNDLLSDNGPESKRGGACVARKPLKRGEEEAYLNALVERPPARPEDGYDLIVEYKGGPSPNIDWLSSLVKPTGRDLFTGIGLQVPATDITYRRGRPVLNLNRAVGPAYDCAFMPMLVGENRRRALLDRMRMYLPTAATGGDEGLAWGLRTLLPSWRGVWADDYPRDFSPRRDKKLVLFSDGKNTTGYGGVRRGPNVIPPLCQRMHELGIEVSVLLIQRSSWDFDDTTLAMYRQCASRPELFQHVTKTADVRRFLREWGRRIYQVRLVS